MKPIFGEDPAGDVAVETRTRLQTPRQFGVILLNDDYTTFEFVVEVLQKFFKKNLAEAEQLTRKVHVEGRAKVAIFPFEIAEIKASQVCDYARERGHPLKAVIEPE